MRNTTPDLPLNDSALAPSEGPADPVKSIELTMKHLNETVKQMRLSVSEVLSATMFCADVQRSLSALIGVELHEPQRGVEPILDQLYKDAHYNLAAMKRAGRQTRAAINGVQQAVSTLYQLAVRLEAQQSRAADSAAGNNELAPFCACDLDADARCNRAARSEHSQTRIG